MSAYTVLNLLELEDATSARIPGMEGRFGRSKMDSRDLGVSHFRYAPGTRSKSAPASPRKSLSGRNNALTRCPRATNSCTRFAPIKPEAPVTKQFILVEG